MGLEMGLRGDPGKRRFRAAAWSSIQQGGLRSRRALVRPAQI